MINGVMVSVVMSVFKESFSWLEISINSILSQTYQNFEFIIVYDNPENEIIWNYLYKLVKVDDRIMLIKNNSNIGLTKSLNKAIDLSSGHYIARMDADDISDSTRIEKQVIFLENNPEISVCGTFIRTIDKSNRVLKKIQYPTNPDEIISELMLCSPFAHPTVMFKSSLKKVVSPLYNITYKTSQDYALWSELYRHKIRMANIPEYLLMYRVSEKQVSKSEDFKKENNAKKIRRDNIEFELKKYNIKLPNQVTNSDIMQIRRLIKNEIDPINKNVLSNILFIYHISSVNSLGKIKSLFLNIFMFDILMSSRHFFIILFSFFLSRWNYLKLN